MEIEMDLFLCHSHLMDLHILIYIPGASSTTKVDVYEHIINLNLVSKGEER